MFELEEGVAGGDVGGLQVVYDDIVEGGFEAVARVETVEGESAGGDAMHVVQEDVAIDREAGAVEGGVGGVENDGVRDGAHADVLEANIVDEAAAAAVALDAESVLGAIDREVVDANGADAAGGLAADSEAVAIVKVSVADGEVGDGAGGGGFGREVVVARAEVGIENGDVGGAGLEIDAIGVAGPLRSVGAEAPGGKAVLWTRW